MDCKGKYHSQHVLPPHTHLRGILHFMREGKYYENECTETTFGLLVFNFLEKKTTRRRRFSPWYLGDGSHGQHLCPLSKCVLSADSQHWVIFTAQLHTLLPDSRVGQYSGPTHHRSWLLPRHTKNLGVYNKQSGIQGRKKTFLFETSSFPYVLLTEQPNKLLCWYDTSLFVLGY